MMDLFLGMMDADGNAVKLIVEWGNDA